MLKKLVLTLLLVVILCALIVNFVIFPTPDSFPIQNYKDKPILIAHAGGAIDGKLYTNSREAVELAIKNGYNFIELDLLITNDGNIVAAHDIQTFNWITGFDSIITPLESNDFKSRKIHERLHPMLADDINDMFEKNGAYLFTDKIEDYDLLNKKITINKDKLLVEVFSLRSYFKALKSGIKYPVLSVAWFTNKLDEYWPFFMAGKIKMITIPEHLIHTHSDKLKSLKEKGVVIFVFTSNDKDFILKHGGSTVSGFYTDSVTYKDLYN